MERNQIFQILTVKVKAGKRIGSNRHRMRMNGMTEEKERPIAFQVRNRH
jgi:hypothetical protein